LTAAALLALGLLARPALAFHRTTPPSRRPSISGDARVIAFESTADLTGNLHCRTPA
jgi:hypothetical protein